MEGDVAGFGESQEVKRGEESDSHEAVDTSDSENGNVADGNGERSGGT